MYVCMCMFLPIYIHTYTYITLRYITLHYNITLHYITLHYITFGKTIENYFQDQDGIR